MTQIIDGRLIAKQIKDEIKTEVAQMIDKGDDTPHLVAIIVGEDPASQTYVASKERASKAVGITSTIYKYPADTTEEDLLKAVDFVNNDDDVDGLIVQLPLPDHINVDKVIDHIDPKKDVDGFHPVSVGKMALGQPSFISATPAGIMELLKRYNIPTEGKHCVVLGRSNIVGSPVSMLMAKKQYPGNATVTLCHSKTANLKEITKQADILICALGVPEFVKADMVKEGAVVIDVGIHRVPADTEKGYVIKGDVDFENVSEKTSFITPVPGGVGPMTIAMLLSNTLKSFKNKK